MGVKRLRSVEEEQDSTSHVFLLKIQQSASDYVLEISQKYYLTKAYRN